MIMAIEQITGNQLHWLKLLHALYIFLLRQAGKAGVFYSADKCFETGANPHNIFDKQILKVWIPLFVGILLRHPTRDFGTEFESLRHRKIFEISTRADKKL